MVSGLRGAHALVIVAMAAAAGCGRPPSPEPVPRAPESLEDALAVIRARSEEVSTVRGGAELIWDDPGTGQRESCSASLSYARPGNLRVRARTAAFFTVFDLVAGPDRVWLDVPREDLTVVGERNDPAWERLPVAPEPLLVALLADPWAGGPRSEDEDIRWERRGGSPWVVAPEWEMLLDRQTGLPVSYRRGDVQISWREWALRRGIPWAHEIEIRTPAGLLHTRLGLLHLDRALRGRLFTFAPEADRELLTPKGAKDRWDALRTPD